jgi:hypothetical protein
MEDFLDSFLDKERAVIGERALRLSEERHVKDQVLKEARETRPAGRGQSVGSLSANFHR